MPAPRLYAEGEVAVITLARAGHSTAAARFVSERDGKVALRACAVFAQASSDALMFAVDITRREQTSVLDYAGSRFGWFDTPKLL